MLLTEQLAKHFRALYFGPNWTAANLKDKLADVSWQQAITGVHSLHSIATLVYHMNYYVRAVTKVLQGGPLEAKDQYSFDHPPVASQQDWQELLEQTWNDAEIFAGLIEALPEERLWETMADPQYGSYYRNIQGIIEHNYYHLGQIAILKTLIAEPSPPSE